jgi:23S rRNA pseudouridine1911/1915/1917 synthase
MAHIGHPLWGDALYAPTGAIPFAAKATAPCGDRARPGFPSRQMLHAWKLAFVHPFPPDGTPAELRLTCPPPEDFFAAARLLASHTLRVVITGSPGCGKSTLAGHCETLGLPVCSADAVVASLYAPGGEGQRLLRARFGGRFVPEPHDPVNKSLLGEAMRASSSLRREVEEMLHPLVRHAVETFWIEQERLGKPVAMAEIPLFLEARFDACRAGEPGRRNRPADAGMRCTSEMEKDSFSRPTLIGVRCPFALRAERLAARGWSGEIIAAVESWQWPEEEKMRACDVVIDNSGDAETFARAAVALAGKLTKMRKERLDAIMRRIRNACGAV